MVDVSSLIYFLATGSDPADPYNLIGFESGDLVSSGLLDPIIPSTIQVVVDNRSTWDAGGEATILPSVSSPWESTANFIIGGGSAVIDVVSSTSGTAFLTGATPTLSNDLNAATNDIVGVGTIRADVLSATDLGKDLNAKDFDITNAALLNAEYVTVDTGLTAAQAIIPILTGTNVNFSNYGIFGAFDLSCHNLSAVNVTANNLSAITLVENLDANSKNITGAGTIKATTVSSTSGIFSNLNSGTERNTNAGAFSVRTTASILSAIPLSGNAAGDLPNIPADGYHLVIDTSQGKMKWAEPATGGGGGNFTGSAVASAIQVLAASAVDISGVNGEVVDTPPNNSIMHLDSAAARIKWAEAAFIIVGGKIVQGGDDKDIEL
ncbi:MAG TPA: hypothetical protein EYN64_00725, partial [Flavobacteriales bacterium]|nr:hypothetical protein [Flavobacteriales bacterium]